MKWFRRGPSPHQAALAMIGAKAGDNVIVTGLPDAALVAELALATGLNGRTLVAGANDRRTALEAAAREAGSLLEFAASAAAARTGEPFDVAVWMGHFTGLGADAQRAVLAELHDLLRPGGRAIVIDRAVKSGGLFSRAAPPAAHVVTERFAAAGWVAARTLASIGDTTYFEARRPR